MSLLANVNQPNPAGYYFALDTTPSSAVVDAQAFVATGGAEVGPSGSFSARGDAVPGGLGMFNITRPDGTATWAIGLDGTPPSGTSTGNNLAVYAYDNSGAFLSAPMQIIRSSGGVLMPNGLVASQVVSTGAMACESLTVDGSNVLLSQPAFLSDISFNLNLAAFGPIPPAIGVNPIGNFTPPLTGLYIISTYVQIDVDATNAVTIGPSDSITVALSGDSSISLKPYSMPNTASNGLDYQLTGCVCALLTGGFNYQVKFSTYNVSGTMAIPLPVSGHVTFTPLVM
jgi:hypothetical protein